MKICVISDLHYKYADMSPEDQENAELILSFLDQAIGKYDLMILAGDVFDLWYDGRYTIIKQYFPILLKLHQISAGACRIVHIAGNHDFWFGDFLPDYLDIELCPEYFEITADGKKIYVCHGDTHTHNDLRYQLYRKLIRLPLMRRMFGLLHPDLALGLGSRLSRSSRSREEPSQLRIKKNTGLRNFAKSLINRGKADYVIMGHSHSPEITEIDSGIYANAGDWIKHHSYIEIDSGEIRLKQFNLNKGETA